MGFTLWELVNRHKESDAVQYSCSIIRGWGEASLDDEQILVLDLLKKLLPKMGQDEVSAVSFFLNRQIDGEKITITAKTLQIMSDIALQIWERYSSTFSASKDQQWQNDPVTYSLNCWPGKLAYFWMGRIRWRYRQEADSWNGLDDLEKKMVRRFVDDEGDFSPLVWTALLTNINMLHSLD